MSLDLELPDLPQVSISVGRPTVPPPAPRLPWSLRWRQWLTTYLPLLLMSLLALASWWLVKNAPRSAGPVEERALGADPDYTMERFALERFDAAGRLQMRVEGVRMQHFPLNDRIEIDLPRIRAVAVDGRVMLAQAKRAVANGDGSEVQLLDSAEVTTTDTAGAPLSMRGDFLHAFLVTEQVRSHLPVVVRSGSSELRAAGLNYNHAAGRLDLQGPMRAEMSARGAPKVSAGPGVPALRTN